MKTAGVVRNSGHFMFSIGLRCFLICLSLFHFVLYMYIYIYIITESRQGDVFFIKFYLHKLKHIIFWHSCAFHQCERTNIKYIEANSNTDLCMS